jgi:hypothetical protein
MTSSKNSLIIVTTGLLGLALAVFILFDRMAAISVYRPVTLAYALIWLFPAALLLRRQARSFQLLVLGLFLAAVAAIYFINWDSRKPFLKDLYRIEPGMTVAQVDRIMSGYLRDPTASGQLSADGNITYRHTTEGWGDSDWGLVTFQDSRVSHVEFLPD